MNHFVIHPDEDGVDPISDIIKTRLLRLHNMVGNVNTTGKSLVFSAGYELRSF